MNWEILLYSACPLMMLFCMKGMFMGNKDKKKTGEKESPVAEQDIQSLQIQMADLIEENKKLEREIKAIKDDKVEEKPPLEVFVANEKQA